jgi:hypothetical protein
MFFNDDFPEFSNDIIFFLEIPFRLNIGDCINNISTLIGEENFKKLKLNEEEESILINRGFLVSHTSISRDEVGIFQIVALDDWDKPKKNNIKKNKKNDTTQNLH